MLDINECMIRNVIGLYDYIELTINHDSISNANFLSYIYIFKVFHLFFNRDNFNFIGSMIYAILLIVVYWIFNACEQIYFSPEELFTYPGIIIVYTVNLFLCPLWQLTILTVRFANDIAVRDYLKRELREAFSPPS